MVFEPENPLDTPKVHLALLPDGAAGIGNPWMDDLYRDYPAAQQQPGTLPPKPNAAETRPAVTNPAAEITPPKPVQPVANPFGHSTNDDNPFVTSTPNRRIGASAAGAAGALFNVLRPGEAAALKPEAVSIPPFRIQEIPAKVDWIKDDAYAAYEKAYREGKPLVIMFEADWCNYCKMMDAEALKSPAFRQFAREAVFLKLDVEKDDKYGNTKQLMTRLGITEYPAIAILEVKPDGVNLRGRIVGYHTPAQFMSSFRQVMPKQITDRYPNDPGVLGGPGAAPILQA